MACPTVEIIGKKIILLSGYERYPQIGSGSVKLGSIKIQEMRLVTPNREQESRRRGVRLHGWEMDTRCLMNF